MIDDKKIEEAANLHRFELIASMHGSTLGTPMQCFEEVVDAETDLIENSFITGAKWAINELIKNLWHPASEEPKREAQRTYILGMTRASESGVLPMLLRQNTDWKEFSVSHAVTRWLYIDDLFKKEGGEQ
jgi:hypothetical protein